ncbi:MAG: acyl carrier protein [Butyrivibrio sp.]|nr:acyl carrier protein [Butyrivibrio sp.]
MEFDKLKEIIAGVLSVDASEITRDMTFVEDLGADSIDIYQILMEIEDEFDVKIDTEEAEKLTTVGEAADLLAKTVNGK